MIDGFKISLPNFDPSVWTQHTGGLAFVTTVDEQGEVLKTAAFHRGLNFRAMPSKKENQKHHATVSGSLHRFHNGGGTNEDDFTHGQLIATIDELETLYHVEAATAKIENFEFGVNISLPFPCQNLFDKIVSMPSKRFNEMTLDAKGSKAYGKRCDRGEYEIKIYDKALQSNINDAKSSKTGAMSDGMASNILRLEVAVKKMRYVKSSGIQVLADFKDSRKIAVLKDILLSLLGDIIYNEIGFSDAAIDNLRLSQRQERQLSRWINPMFWEQMDWKQRKNERANYDKFVKTFLPPQYQTGKMLNMYVAEKWENLAANHATNSEPNYYLTRDKSNNSKMDMETLLQNTGKTTQKDPNYNFDKTKVIVTDSELETLLTQSDTIDAPNGRFSPLCKHSNIDVENGVPFDTIKVGFHPLLKGENLQNNNKQKNLENLEKSKIGNRTKSVKTIRACPCCKTDVSMKRPNAVFCSKRCKKKNANAKRDRRMNSVTPKPPPTNQQPPPKTQNEKFTVGVNSAMEATPSVSAEKFDIQAALKALEQNMRI